MALVLGESLEEAIESRNELDKACSPSATVQEVLALLWNNNTTNIETHLYGRFHDYLQGQHRRGNLAGTSLKSSAHQLVDNYLCHLNETFGGNT